MGIRERKERERDERRSLILETAMKIISEEGPDSFSLRKIAGRIEYSPAVIYLYFKNKDDIIEHLMKIKYGDLMNAMEDVALIKEPEIQLAEFGRRYVNWALESPELYKALMLSNSPAILDNSSVLFKGASLKRPAIRFVLETAKKICQVDDEQAELITQIIWTSMFGLIIRMITENVPDEQRQRLIVQHTEYTINAVRAMKMHQ